MADPTLTVSFSAHVIETTIFKKVSKDHDNFDQDQNGPSASPSGRPALIISIISFVSCPYARARAGRSQETELARARAFTQPCILDHIIIRSDFVKWT